MYFRIGEIRVLAVSEIADSVESLILFPREPRNFLFFYISMPFYQSSVNFPDGT